MGLENKNYRGYKIIVCIPAGRRNLLELCINYILKEINTSITSYLHQRLNCFNWDVLKEKNPIFNSDCFDHNGWGEGRWSELIHNRFIENLRNNNLYKYKFYSWIILDYTRISINC